MKDEFWLLRPAILFSTGFLVLGIVLHVCRQSAEQRERMLATARSATNDPAMKSTAAFRVFPPESLPGRAIEIVAPAAD